ncbi:MAG: UDP-N-acetylmuramoyl-L-alanyl-D-glutamate--2,6-diaminopimelate ligase [Legionella sp.]|nr:MAG: UDP-N-acetylmuramoyl-L-alanyl-D-glutamate--2,6-diaminopimelate ligase [Legionella sp.]
MNLSELLKPWLKTELAHDCIVQGLQNDSRSIQTGDLFIAYPGAAADGRQFINKAISAGAVAIAYEPAHFDTANLPKEIPCVAIPQLAEYLGAVAKRFYKNPSANMQVIGVTGTNGKTTIAYQLAQAHSLLGHKSAYIGTIGEGEVNALKPLNITTPDALCLQKLMHEYQQQGIEYVCMEVSSHALSQHRVDAIEFNQALYTNLTLDHLDYHHTMEEYGAAKALLFARPELQYAIVNQDDPYHQLMQDVIKPQVKVLTYGLHDQAEIRAVDWHMDIQGTTINTHSPWGEHSIQIQALGQFNIYNSLAIFTSLLASGYSIEQVVHVMKQLKSAPGRMEIVASKPYVLVDYAHTPDALENVLTTLNQIKQGRLWVVFGCGGDRDKSKRPIMGKVASLYADKIVVTSDNPRSEVPDLIIEDIVQGIPSTISVTKQANREEAIHFALSEAAQDDIILIAGKGHEAYQQIGQVKHKFSDQEVVKRLLSQ